MKADQDMVAEFVGRDWTGNSEAFARQLSDLRESETLAHVAEEAYENHIAQHRCGHALGLVYRQAG